jgi:hypothetical protein
MPQLAHCDAKALASDLGLGHCRANIVQQRAEELEASSNAREF